MDTITRGPTIVSGFFNDSRGVAQAARLMVAGLRNAGVDVIEHDVTYLLDRRLPRENRLKTQGGMWLIVCNPAEALAVLDQHRELSEAPLYRIGAWVWELPTAPDDWIRASELFHEIWAPSQFCANAFSASHAPVWVMPYPVPLVKTTSPAAMYDRRVQFTIFADLRSGAVRKNPLGGVAAYLRAFRTMGEARLLIKLLGAEADLGALSALKTSIIGRDDVELLVQSLSDAEMAALYERTDVVISLHRAEGYGLTLAQAMAAGKAVVATGWSGNLEFMTGDAARQLVNYTLTPVDDPSGLYSDAQWAEPDVATATKLILDLARGSEFRQSLMHANRAAIDQVNSRWASEALAERLFLGFARRVASG